MDELGTWLAINAYLVSSDTHGNFMEEVELDEDSMRELTAKAVAMSMVAVFKMDAEAEGTVGGG